VVSAAYVYERHVSASEIRYVQCQCLNGSFLSMCWYQLLSSTMNMPLRVRYAASSFGISLDRACPCGGISHFSMRNTSRTSEERCVSYDYLNGSGLRMWWYQRLPYTVRTRVPVRYTVRNATISPARAFVCGGINDSRISKNRLHQRDVDERLSVITSISLDRSSACSNISALCMGIGTQYQ
jgi:hypothetical protein